MVHLLGVGESIPLVALAAGAAVFSREVFIELLAIDVQAAHLHDPWELKPPHPDDTSVEAGAYSSPQRAIQSPFTPRTEEEQMSETIDSARRLIAERLSAIEAEASQLQRALKSIGERDGSRPAAPAKPRRKRAPSKRRRSQAPRGRRREELLGAIEAEPGSRPAELAAEIGVSASQVHGLIVKARAEKLIVKRGAGYALKG